MSSAICMLVADAFSISRQAYPRQNAPSASVPRTWAWHAKDRLSRLYSSFPLPAKTLGTFPISRRIYTNTQCWRTQVRALHQQSSLNIKYHHTINSSPSPTIELAVWLKVSLPMGAGLHWPFLMPISENLPRAVKEEDGESPSWKGLWGSPWHAREQEAVTPCQSIPGHPQSVVWAKQHVPTGSLPDTHLTVLIHISFSCVSTTHLFLTVTSVVCFSCLGSVSPTGLPSLLSWLFYSLLLVQHLAHSRCSKDVSWNNEWILQSIYPPETPTILQYVRFCSLAPTYSFPRIPQLLSALTHPQTSQLSPLNSISQDRVSSFWTIKPWE